MKKILYSFIICTLVINCTANKGEKGNNVIGNVEDTTDILICDTSQAANAESDTVIYELPQCQLLYSKELPDKYGEKPISMWTEYKDYCENVPFIHVFVTNPTDVPLDFGRKWNLHVWNGEKFEAPKQKPYLIIWEDDLFLSSKAPLLYRFRFPVGEYYYLPKGKYRIAKIFNQKGKKIELHADFEIK